MTNDVELRLTADADGATRGIAEVRKEYAELIKSVQKPLKQVPVFRDLEVRLEETGRRARSARERVRELGDELARTDKPSKALTSTYRQAVTELGRLERAEATAKAQLVDRRRELQAAGVDTSNLVSEQHRLAAEIESLTAARRAELELVRARGRLGVGRIEQEQRALVELRAQYRLVSADSSLSAKQRAEAEAAYRSGVGRTLDRLRQLRAATAVPVSKAEAASALLREAEAAEEAARSLELLSARRSLGVGQIREQQQELLKLRQQYQLVQRDGALSARERAEAETAYRRRVSDTLERLRELRTATAKQANEEEREAQAQARRHLEARQGIAQVAAAQRQAALESRRAGAERARDNLGINQARAAQQEIANLRAQYDQLRRSGALSTKELAIAQRQLKQRIAETKAALRGLSSGGGGTEALSGVAGEIPGLSRLPIGRLAGGGPAGVAAAIAAGTAAMAAAAAQGSDEVGRLDARLRLATRSQDEFNAAQLELDRIADVTQGDVSDLVGLYSRLQRPMREAGLDQKATLETIEAVSLGLKIGGSSVEESTSVIQQFSQAMSRGVLQGEEFAAVLEGSDRLAGALAESLGVTIGQLREMSSNGELTAQQVTAALRKELPKLREEMNSFAPEIGAGFRRIFAETKRSWGRFAKESGATDAVAEVLNDLAKSINGSHNLIKKSDSALTKSLQRESASRLEILKQEKANTEQARKELLSDLEQTMAQQRTLIARTNSELLAAKKQQQSIAEEFKASTAEFSGAAGSSGDASFGDVVAAKASARQKVQLGDRQGAIDDARRGIEILRQLRSAGENEFGFAGVARELEAIANQAARVDTETAKAKDGLAKMELENLSNQARFLENITIRFGLDASSVETVKQQMGDLAKGLSEQMTIQVKVVPPPEMGAPGVPTAGGVEFPAFASGGIATGPGTGTSDSIWAKISNGEGILTARAVQHYGAGLVHQLNRLQVPRFATGGVMGERALPAIPMPSPSLMTSANGKDLGTVIFELGGGRRIVTQADPDNFQTALRFDSRKHGKGQGGNR
ncbi:tape measure protein [Metapseudomonas furukawaii]|uniref:tape measure protein n=1 Tax=Metapseudomonas furukawaii TaxID=1149133 RepID=UPI0040457A88